MLPDEAKTSIKRTTESGETLNALSEIKQLQKQLDDERKASEKKEAIMISSLQESKQMANHLQQLTQALAKERRSVLDKSEQEKLLWKLIERINSTFDLEHILQSTVDELGHYFKVNRCGIIIPNYKQNNKDLVREYSEGDWKRSPETYSQVSLSILYRTVTKTLQPLIINDTLTHELTAGHLNEDLRSILMVPLLQNNTDLVGVVYLHQCRKQRTWSKNELAILQSAANPIATAVEKSKLFNRIKSWASKEKLLNRLTSRIRSSLNIRVILERTVAELGQALQVSRCFINIIDPRTSREIISHEYTSINTKPIGIGKENPLIINKLAEKSIDYITIIDIYKEPRLAKLSNNEVEQLHKTSARAFLTVQITFQNKIFGWLCFHQCGVPRYWTNEEVSFVQAAASQVGVAINQAEMVEELKEYQTKISRELKQAQQLQSILLSAGTDIKKNLPIAACYHPHHNVSGDFYWIFELAPHLIGILIGDVSGKGPAAALLTGYIIGEIKGLLKQEETTWHPETFLTTLSDSIYEQNQFSDFYATAWYGIFNILDKKLICCNAGHPSPYLITDETITKINDLPGVPLGLLSVKDAVGKYEKKEFDLKLHNRMLIFTDGLTEQRQLEGDFVPESWLIDALASLKKCRLNELPEQLIRKLNIASKGAPQDDDRLIVAAEIPETQLIELDQDKQDYIQDKIQVILEDALSNGLPKDLQAGLKLGLIEAIYNSFRHGLPKVEPNKRKVVTVAWWVQTASFSCTIRDPGPGFNWQDAIKRIKDVDILSEGGRGLPLLFEIFNTVVWNPEGNELGLTLKW